MGGMTGTSKATELRQPSMPRMLARGLVRHCPRCGSGGLFKGYFELREACPGCGCRFECRPEDGFFLGALTINLAITEGILLLGVFAYIAVLAMSSGDGPPVWPVVTGAVVLSILLPIAFYPFAKTIWAAFELMLNSMEGRSSAC
jgi:uncharacterized protein (DUF983 family)